MPTHVPNTFDVVPPSKPNPGESLADLFPEIAAQADGWDPTSVRPGSGKKMPWRCTLGHKWSTSPLTRTSGSGCPVCGGKVVVPGYNDLATHHPEIAAEADGWDPTTVTRRSSRKLPWKCNLGHKWETRPADRVAGNNCPFCSRRALLPGFNDLATEYPDIAAQADGWDPTTVMPRTMHKRAWVCAEGHRWVATVAGRTGGNGCPVCVNKQVLPGYNDLATTHPAIAAQADGWDPSTTTFGSTKKRAFRCPHGHVVKQDVVVRVASDGQCPICNGKQVLPGYNDLATTHPLVAAQADGWDPSTLTGGSNKNMPWVCALGHRWVASVGNRTAFDQGCPYCTGKKVWAGFNDLLTTHPEIAAEADGWDPRTVSRGSHKKQAWVCAEGHRWMAATHDRASGYGCPGCASSGYDSTIDGFLYLLEHDEKDMLQVGITNTPDIRLRSHGRGGWTPIDLRGPMDGTLARSTEKAILNALKARGATMAPTVGGTQFDGWTEAWLRTSLPVLTLKELLDMVHEDDEVSR